MQLLRSSFLKDFSLNMNHMYGRRGLVKHYLSVNRNSGYNIAENELEKLYQKIKKRYTEIRVHSLDCNRLGEYVPRYLTAVEDSIKNEKKGILDVFVLTDCINHNTRLSEVIGRNIRVINDTNVHTWEYILRHFPKVEFSRYWDQYSERNMERFLKSEHTARYFTFTDEERKEGEYKKFSMGINRPFVCVSSRDSVYLHKIEPRINWHYHDYRDSDINRLNLSAEYLDENGITTVRMGRYVKDQVNFNNCIDYANQYYDELMDLILMKDCKFYIGDSNGTCVLPMAFNRPVALKNVIPAFLDAWGTHPQNPQNLFIFKKYYKKEEKRFLSIKEMMEIEHETTYYGQKYKKLGIEVIENSAEEILDLTIEMNARIDGKWIEEPEDLERQLKYQNILKEWIRQEHLKENAMLYAKVGAAFLRKNTFLLE